MYWISGLWGRGILRHCGNMPRSWSVAGGRRKDVRQVEFSTETLALSAHILNYNYVSHQVFQNHLMNETTLFWIPAFAGMTFVPYVPVIPAKAGIQKSHEW